MRRALSTSRLRPSANPDRLLLGARLPYQFATNTRHCRAAPLTTQPCRPLAGLSLRRLQHTQREEPPTEAEIAPDAPILRRLPLQCTGCGAFTQTTEPEQAGYFRLQRKAIQEYLGLAEPKPSKAEEVEEGDRVVEEVMRNLPPEELEALGLTKDAFITSKDVIESPPEEKLPPVCDRCQGLTHHQKAEPIFHPSVHSLAEIIDESPHKYNHVYHLIDAADFPLSLVPRLHVLLGDVNLRTVNRRSRKDKFYADRKIDLSFIITRGDLLAPKAEQVNALMPYLREVLRDALGRVGDRVRLGNVRCVSANRGWWTTGLKKEIYERGGAGWMVGKANVGKSSLFEVVFPKGRMGSQDLKKLAAARSQAESSDSRHQSLPAVAGEDGRIPSGSVIERPADLNIGEWLPPARPETNYPAMPTISWLPGTTASPIRIPFGNGKGELIDLPGLARSDLEEHVQPAHRSSLIMKSRIKPVQETIKPGQSLLLGGFIRITPRTPDLVFLAASFTPLKAHLTSTEKAIGIQKQEGTLAVENISVPGTGDKIERAGSFALSYDVTKQRAGPLTRKDALRKNPADLPFRVLAIDILIEGVGWVEIAAQVRTADYPHQQPEPSANKTGKKMARETRDDPWTALDRAAGGAEAAAEAEARKAEEAAETRAADERSWPVVDVFTPEGRFVGSRRPMGGYLMNKAKDTPVKRLRTSMKGEKKRGKMAKRAARADSAA